MLHNSSIGIVMKFAPDAPRPDHIAIRSLWARRGFVDCCGDLPDGLPWIIARDPDAVAHALEIPHPEEQAGCA
jgi:hypothetical protein